jgi:hypothetical protein
MASLGSSPQAASTLADSSFNAALIRARMTLSFMQLQCSYIAPMSIGLPRFVAGKVDSIETLEHGTDW